ncbi:hypothetical protein Tco_0382103 [Tanacetum coccineum]
MIKGSYSKVLQERGIGGLPGSTEPNPWDHVKSISTTKVDLSEIRRMECSPDDLCLLRGRNLSLNSVDEETHNLEMAMILNYDALMPKSSQETGESTSIVDPMGYVAHTTTAPVFLSSTSIPQPTAQSRLTH